MSEREAFVEAAQQPRANRRALCREFRISAETGYRWIRRAAAGEGLADRSRRPRTSPGRTAAPVEAAIVEVRRREPTWSGRKVQRFLQQVHFPGVPNSPATVTAVLRRHGLLDGPGAGQPRAFVRFEHARPNDFWQMDFKGHVPCGGRRCHPLDLLDDCSRFNITLAACADERTETVQERLAAAFAEYGRPLRIGCDNGAPWGNGPGDRYTPLVVWLLRQDVVVSHSRPYHPQTLGKVERFHRSFKAEVLARGPLLDFRSAQRRFDAWRHVYNYERPHEALDDATPASRYTPSPRPHLERLPPIEYPEGDLVRQVQQQGRVSLLGRTVRVPQAFTGYPLGFRPTEQDGCYQVVFATIPIAEVDLSVVARGQHTGVTHVSEHPSRMSLV